MGITRNYDVDNYLPMKRIVLLSFAITIAFYILYTFSQYFGRPNFPNNSIKEELRLDLGDKGGDTRTMEMTRHHRPGPPHGELGPDGKSAFKRPKLAHKLLLNIPLTFILVFSVFFFNKRILGVTFRHQRDQLVASILGSLFIALLLSTLFTLMQLWIWPHLPGPPKSTFHHVRSGWLGDLPLMAIAVMACYLLRSLYQEKIVAVENETLRTENIRTRYEALKNQMDPHFLFNSLNTLKSLIETDVDKAEEFVQQLSSVLRYTLQNSEVVSLSDELTCVEAYCNMMQIRYGDNLRFVVDINPEYRDYKVLPLSIQGLIENAIKHNVISNRQPLTVHVVSGEATVKVSNTKQPKVTQEEGSGIGLANLVERYRIKWNENVEIFDDGKVFVVTLPLKQNE